MYTARMGGIFSFYVALCTIPSPRNSPAAFGDAARQLAPGHPLVPSPPPAGEPSPWHARPLAAYVQPAGLWAWCARATGPPLSNHFLAPTLWASLLEVGGQRLVRVYGAQMTKMVQCLYTVLGLGTGPGRGAAGGGGGGAEPGSGTNKPAWARDGAPSEAKSARVRLEIFLHEWAQGGRRGFSLPKGAEVEP